MEHPKDFEELHCNHWYCQYWEKATLDHFWFWDTSFLSLISISLPHKGMEETVFHSFKALFLDTAKLIHFLYDRSITSSNLEKSLLYLLFPHHCQRHNRTNNLLIFYMNNDMELWIHPSATWNSKDNSYIRGP